MCWNNYFPICYSTHRVPKCSHRVYCSIDDKRCELYSDILIVSCAMHPQAIHSVQNYWIVLCEILFQIWEQHVKIRHLQGSQLVKNLKIWQEPFAINFPTSKDFSLHFMSRAGKIFRNVAQFCFFSRTKSIVRRAVLGVVCAQKLTKGNFR